MKRAPQQRAQFIYDCEISGIGRRVPVFEAVQFFQEAAGHADHTPEIFALYMKFIDEEFGEVCLAHAATFTDNSPKTKGKLLKELFDLLWVTAGAINAMGVDERDVWEEGTVSNLAKIDMATGRVLRREDGKVLKPEGWVKPDFSKFFEMETE